MRNVEHQSTAGSDGILPRISILVVIGFLIGFAGAVAMADDAAEEAIPPEFSGKIMPTGTSDDPKAQVAGKEIYEGKINPAVNCSRCHGSDGKPTKLGKGAPDLSDPTVSKKHSDAQWFWRISEKKAGTTMPSYKDKLTEEQRWHVIAYLRTLAPSGK
ncbi:MAG: cytochrome c [Nitrospira sp.]|nr:cytochrome c [Nitrospira sp.]